MHHNIRLPPHFRSGRRQRRQAAEAALFLLPSLAAVTLFLLGPSAETLRRSVTDALGAGFVGLANYRAVLGNTAFRLAVKNTVRFAAVCVPLLLVCSLLFALLLRQLLPGGRQLQTLILLPMAVPVSAAALLWKALFAQNGMVNALLASLGAQPVDFLGSGAVFWVLVGTYLWRNVGYDMLLWLAGLNAIPAELYEAAAVDGAGARQMLFRITLPNLPPTLALITLLSVLNTGKVYREAYLVAGNYPHESIYLLQHLFNNWFAALDLGRLSAAAVLTAASLLIVLVPLVKLLLKGGD